MIAKSDVVILAVSASLLAAGIYRWQSNLSQPYGRHTAAAAPISIQGSATNSQTARPSAVTDGVSRNVTADIEAPVATNFGNADQASALQSSTSSAAIATENSISPTSTTDRTGQPLYGEYEVQSGDSLSRIAILHGTTVDTLRTINGISGSLIIVGQSILYPLPAN